ncbi:hypothetical protein C0J52_14125 [Blattella germanica]|nr:hypothetical protein C0J52_14125 [Blattella germanica]
MASASEISRVLQNGALLDYYDTLPTDLSDYSNFEDYHHHGDPIYNTSAIIISENESDENGPPEQAASQTKRQRTGFHWDSGKFVPKIHMCNDENSGISVDIKMTVPF